jgi:hypothetical protein
MKWPFLILLATTSCSCDRASFDKEAWKVAESEQIDTRTTRGKMASDLVERYLKPGMSRSEVNEQRCFSSFWATLGRCSLREVPTRV